jgi:mRNA interferase HigB
MRVIAISTLQRYWERRPDSESPLRAWFAEAKAARWTTPAELKAQFASASIVKNSRVVFNIAGNKHRLIVGINYELGIVFVKFIGNHKEYDEVDPETIEFEP